MLQRLWHRIASPVDPFLGILLAILLSFTTIVMLSASPDRIQSQLINTLTGLVITWVVANISQQKLQSFALPLYIIGVLLLIAVALFGDVSKGARRWLHVGVTRIQPSELLKIAMPLMLAWYFQQREGALKAFDFIIALVLLLIPVGLIAKQPDLGTAVLVLSAGLFVIFFAGLVVEADHPGHARGNSWGRRDRRNPGQNLRPGSRLAGDEGFPEAPRLHLARPFVRPARQGLPHNSIDDRGRIGRNTRQRLAQRHTGPARVHPRAAHRLHLRGDLRGMGPGRQPRAADRVPVVDLPRADDRSQRSQPFLSPAWPERSRCPSSPMFL